MDHDVQSKVLTSHSFMRLTHKALKERGLPNLSQLSESRREVGSSTSRNEHARTVWKIVRQCKRFAFQTDRGD